MLALAALVLVPRIVLGFLVIELSYRSQSKSRLLELFLAGPVGVGISSLMSFLWIWIGLDLHVYSAIEFTSILLFSILVVWKHRTQICQAWQNQQFSWSAPVLGWLILVGTAAFMFCAQFWEGSIQKPHGGYDAWAVWNVVARFVYRGGIQWRGTFLRMYVYSHPDYPFLIPMTNAITWELLQKETTRGPMVLAFMFTVCVVGLLFGLLRELRGSQQASIITIIMLTQPLLVQSGIWQLADGPEACYFLASACMTLLYFQSRDTHLILLAGLTAGLSAWTKNEGLVFVTTSFVFWAYISWRERGLMVKDYLLGAGGPLIIIGLFKAFLAPSNDLFSGNQGLLVYLADPARYIAVLREVGTMFWSADPSSYLVTVPKVGGTFWSAPQSLASFLLILIAYACLVGKTISKIQGLSFLSFIVGTQALVYYLVFVTTPYDINWHVATSLPRLYLHLFPLILVALFLWLKSPDELNVLNRGSRLVSHDKCGEEES